MKHIVKIAFLWLCAALILTACDRNRHTPEPEPQKEPISFSALSQIPAVKADDGTTPLSEYHEDFGVWGIARHSSYSPYILWEDEEIPMVKVEAVLKNDPVTNEEIPTSEFVPVSGAYWIQGYTYSFIAIAPYTGGAEELIDSESIDSEADDCSFTLDMGAKYEAGNYTFDLMGAAARSSEVTVASKQEAQSLNFHHLLAKININVDLKDSKDGPSLGTVSKVKLQGLNTCLDYTLSFDKDNKFTVSSGTPDAKEELAFTTDPSLTEASFQQSLNVVPQSISDFKLYIDFTLGTGKSAIAFTDFFVDIASAPNQPATGLYERNQVYNWNITIGSKEDISFTVTVTPWGKEPVGDEIEIY